ncbi:RND family transporter [Psychrobium sp. 1_MG-2023]|uniref:efflux RND transporter permease subunit n=1 Tax=Psychrobium sp. 1_MG-2023 TaxID=3062624 RepID=UPI000C3267A2|nr:MMPL family transporter [Psychrobium sp. 1_MG-2023]MDP2561159.1 MMPL family transporter [Psychrobium sp. 1_MG-2023]PKF55133.1 RND transporter [Alteromonadales bacterium alter-6D02]
MLKTMATFLVRHRFLSVLLLLLVIIVAAAGGKNLQFNGDYRVFFGQDDPNLLAFDSMQANFNKSDNVAIIVAPKDGEVFTKQTLSLVWQLTDQAWQIPHSIRVDSITNYQHTQSIEDDLYVEDLLLELDDLNPQKIASMQSIALNEPALLKKLIAPDKSSTVINVTIQLPGKDFVAELPQTGDYVTRLIEEYKAKYPEVDFHLSGVIAMNKAFADESQQDAETLIPIMFVAIVILLAILLRSLTAMFASLIIIVTSIGATMGLAGWLGIDLTTTTVSVPTIVMTLAVADCVHLVSGVFYAMQKGMEKNEAIIKSYQLNFMPIFLTSITTSIGFLTLNFSYSPAMRDLGNLVAIGVMLAFVLSVTLYPALLAIVKLSAPSPSQKQSPFISIANFVIAHYRNVAIIGSLIVIAISAMLFTNKINDVAVEYFSPKTEFRQATDYMGEHLAGITSISFSIDSGETNGINKPEFLALVDQFVLWLEQQPETDHVSTITTTIKRLNKNMHGDKEAFYRLPESRELSAQYLLMYEMSLPYGLDLNNQLNIDKSATRVMANFKSSGSDELLAIEQRAVHWFEQHASDLKVGMASTALVFAHIGERNMSSMLLGSAIALVLISMLVGLSLRSKRLGFISLLPNIAPAAIGFGIWAILDGNINLALSVVTSITLGIVVDDTIHFLSKYNIARKQGLNAEDSIKEAFEHVGKALWITTVVLTIGFMILTLSNFKMNADMGLLTAVIITIALIVDFLLLPAFLLIFDKSVSHKELSNDPQST